MRRLPSAVLMFVGVGTLMVALAGCASLPLPDSPDQSLVIFAYDYSSVNLSGSRRIQSASLEIVHVPTGKRSVVQLSRLRNWSAVALDPGAYRLETLNVRIAEGEERFWTDTHSAARRAYVNPQTVMLLPLMLRMYDRSGGRDYVVAFPRVVTGTPLHQRVSEEVRRDQIWLAWEGYEEVNLHEPEP